MNDDNNDVEITAPAQQADDRLLHSLLLHLYDAQATEHREQRIGRAMQALHQQAQRVSVDDGASGEYPYRISRAASRIRRYVALAAALLIVLGIWLVINRPVTAMASINQIIAALARPGDRTFHIALEELADPLGRPNADEQQPTRPRPGLNDATLYLRNQHQYVLVRQDPSGGQIFDGFNGQQSWRIRKGVVAETQQGPGAGGIPMPPMMANVPFSDLQQTLERIRVDYTIERKTRGDLKTDGESLRHVRVRRNSREVKGPDTIDIWADPNTSVPRRILFDRAKLQGSPAPCRLTFDLVSEGALPANWFDSAPHTDIKRNQDRNAPPAD